MVVNWQGWEIETSVFMAVVALVLLLALSLLVWSLLRAIATSPSAIGRLFRRRREQRGLEALSAGMIAVGAGDKALAGRYAAQARKALPNEPLTALLRAQAAELSGDRATARRIFESMLGSPDTELLGLRGLFLEAEREGEIEAARQLAERAVRRNPRLRWAVDALFDLQCRQGDWTGALDTLAIARRHGLVSRKTADRRRAVLLTGLAQRLEETEMDKALEMALEAHKLAPDLVPAAEIAGRILAAKGNTPRAAKIIARTWKRAPHPDLALVYAFARPGDSPKDRLERVKDLAAITPHNIEAPIAVAEAAIEARQWDVARKALEPLLEKRLTARVCVLMARIEDGEHGDRGRAREWLARAVNARRDPAWTADGMVSERWAPVSPVSGRLDAFEWKVPVEVPQGLAQDRMLQRLVALSGGMEALVARESGDGREVVHAGAEQGEPVVLHADAGTAEEPSPAPGGAAAAASPLAPGEPAEPVAQPVAQPSAHGAGRPSAAAAMAQSEAASAEEAREDTAAASAVPEAVPPATPLAASTSERPATEEPGKRGEEERESGPAIFVPPRPPDDPGPDDDLADMDAPANPLARYRLPPVKGSA